MKNFINYCVENDLSYNEKVLLDKFVNQEKSATIDRIFGKQRVKEVPFDADKIINSIMKVITEDHEFNLVQKIWHEKTGGNITVADLVHGSIQEPCVFEGRKIQKGSKLVRTLDKVIGDDLESLKYGNRLFILIDKALNTAASFRRCKLYMSIDPIDYVSMSDPDNGWTSCYAPGGLAKGSPLALLRNRTSVLFYLSPHQASRGKYSFPIKRWRAMGFLDEKYFTLGVHYPFDDSYLTEHIVNYINVFCDFEPGYVEHTFEDIDSDLKREGKVFVSQTKGGETLKVNHPNRAICTECGEEFDNNFGCNVNCLKCYRSLGGVYEEYKD